MIALRRSLFLLLVLLVVLAALFYAAFPMGTYLDQTAAIAEARAELDALYQENHELRVRSEVLSEPGEIERLARSQYNLVYPGEVAYAILPPAPEPVEIPDLWPFNALVSSLTHH